MQALSAVAKRAQAGNHLALAAHHRGRHAKKAAHAEQHVHRMLHGRALRRAEELPRGVGDHGRAE
eukprot:scaffold70136_cov55-Phaeocystis_antarctica.AAC.3